MFAHPCRPLDHRLSIEHEEYTARCPLPPGVLELLPQGGALRELSVCRIDALNSGSSGLSLLEAQLAEGIRCAAVHLHAHACKL